MKQVKIVLFSIVTVFFISNLSAQSIAQGKKYLYYEKFVSARNEFQKILAANPNNEEAIYWLGQAMILPDDRTAKDLADAKTLYQTNLAVMPNSTLIMAGIGHIELIEGKVQDARNHFEAAISLSQGKSILVLNAIGFANGNPDSKNGDPLYAIDKLKQATQIKKFNDPDVLVNLGDAYRKNGDGANAIISYQAALALDPKFARANYRIGRLYQSQGRNQEPIFMEHYDAAIANDPAYAPIYNNLFNYFYETNVAKSAEYFDKWQAVSDPDSKVCYYKASLKYAQGLFNEAITKADECIAAQGSNPYPSLFGLKAIAYNRLKDSIKAIEYFAEYFKRQSPDKITAGDYIEYVKNLLKIPGNEEQANLFIDRAISLDSVEANKVQYLKTIAQFYEGKKNYKNAAEIYDKLLAVKRNPSKYDYNTAAFNYYKSGDFRKSIDAFTLSSNKFPDDPYAFNMIGKASWAIDSTMAQGLANAAFEKVIQLGLADTIKYKPQLMTSYKYFVAYYANIKKDKNMAMLNLEKALSLDPADIEANNFKAVLTSPMKSPSSKN